MAVAYIAMSSVVIILHWEMIPSALSTIVTTAFTGASAAGGFAGATVWAAIRFGVARGIFSNEAGLGQRSDRSCGGANQRTGGAGIDCNAGHFYRHIGGVHNDGLSHYAHRRIGFGVSGASLTAMAFGVRFRVVSW
jgi:AGCS family alanine or glycine:cation symporter